LSDGDVIEAGPVNTSLTRLKDEINGGLDNNNILVTRSTPLISGAKIDFTTNAIFTAQHGSDGSHTNMSNFTYGLRATNNASTPESQVDVNAYNISVLNEAGTARKLIGSVDITAVMQAAASGQNGLDTGSPATSTAYYLYIVNDSEDTETTLCVFSTESSVNSTLYSNVQANVLPTVTHALQVGYVYRDANGNLGRVRPVIGGGYAQVFEPRWVMAAHGVYQGTGASFDVDTVGFRPDYVMIKATNAVTGAVYSTGSHVPTYSSGFTGIVENNTWITALNWDGFTVGDGAAVNTNSIYYVWVAWKVHEGVSL
jgi:hypothetical protein